VDETASIEAIVEKANAGDAEAQNDLGRHLADERERLAGVPGRLLWALWLGD
jgi:hypothetical protein